MSNYRDSFNDRNDDDRRDESEARWRRGEERYRREAYGAQSGNRGSEYRYGEDRYDSRGSGDFGYGRAFRDDDQGGRGGYGAGDGRERGYGQRGFSDGRNYDRDQPRHHWHAEDHDRRAGHPYTGTYGGTGDTNWFSGTNQGSWAVGDPRVQNQRSGSTPYGTGGQYGGSADYRSHGYGGARYDDDGRRGFWDRASDEVASWFGDEDAARRREQDHRGRGPQGYTRSDERIREDANDRLTDDWRVDASNIEVTVKDGEVTLAGTVTSREAKRRAEDIVDAISGVKHVQNNLRVQQTTGGGGFTGNWATNSTSTAEGGVATAGGSGTSGASSTGTTTAKSNV